MPNFQIWNAALFGASAFVAALAALSLISYFKRPGKWRFENTDFFGGTLVFLICGGELIDANFSARRLLDFFGAKGLEIGALARALHARFDDPEQLIDCDRSRQSKALISRDGCLQAVAEISSRTIRLKISSRARADAGSEDIHLLSAQDAELKMLRETSEMAPYLVWRETPNGTPIWVNRAYHSLVQKVFGAERAATWPLPRLFGDLRTDTPTRASIRVSGEDCLQWFECHRVPIGRDSLFTAFDTNSTVRAETQLRDFMQTLTKTFAQLTIGLAIFDRSRNLALFNPALTELTRLPVDFLTTKPSLIEVLDKLREMRMIPEPKDYRSWRKSIADLEAAAADGSYLEKWSLPGNLTYRVTGRPHPDGAIAFLIEDISAEMSVTRNFRREIEISQTLLDNMEDATVLFSRTGTIAQVNDAYRILWSVDPDSSLQETSIIEATRFWQEKSVPTPVWGDFREFAADNGDRTEWSAKMTLKSGRVIECRFIPLAGGSTQVVFRAIGDDGRADKQLLEAV